MVMVLGVRDDWAWVKPRPGDDGFEPPADAKPFDRLATYWSRLAARLPVVGVALVLPATLHPTWPVSQGRDTTAAQGSLTGALLVSVVSLAWIFRDRSRV
jgi:hypothetical protein